MAFFFFLVFSCKTVILADLRPVLRVLLCQNILEVHFSGFGNHVFEKRDFLVVSFEGAECYEPASEPVLGLSGSCYSET